LRRRFFYKFRPLPDRLGAAAKSLGDSQAQCLCGVQIDDELSGLFWLPFLAAATADVPAVTMTSTPRSTVRQGTSECHSATVTNSTAHLRKSLYRSEDYRNPGCRAVVASPRLGPPRSFATGLVPCKHRIVRVLTTVLTARLLPFPFAAARICNTNRRSNTRGRLSTNWPQSKAA